MRALEALLLAAGVERRAEGGALLAPLHAALRPALNYSSGARLTALTPHPNPNPNPNPNPAPNRPGAQAGADGRGCRGAAAAGQAGHGPR